jgi:hypothetical protein
VLLEPPHQTLDHIAPSVGRPAESRRTPASPVTLARRDTLLGDHTAGTATAQVSTEGTRIITPIRHHQLRAVAGSAARRTGLYPHIPFWGLPSGGSTAVEFGIIQVVAEMG